MSATKAEAIKRYCRDCAGDSPHEVTLCHIVNCPLWPFRFGNSINDKQFKARMLRARKGYPEEFEEICKLASEYLLSMQDSPKKAQIRAFFHGISEVE